MTVVCERAGNFEVRLAANADEIAAALRLRYRVFYEEMAARPSPEMAARGEDFDRFDDVADHLLLLDHARGSGPAAVVGTYRLLRRAAAAKTGQFYSADEYDISSIVGFPGEILELGRSCVDEAYRSSATPMQLLWRAIAAYVSHYAIEIMFGCASLPGTDPETLALPLSYLHHWHLAPAEIRPRALAGRYVSMNMLAREQVDPKAALAQLPPLIKGYLRLGGFVGDGAVIDHQFNTTDVSIIVKTDLVTQKYVSHYERAARRAPNSTSVS